MSQTCGHTSVMSSPSARRSPPPYYRSTDHRPFSLRTTLPGGMEWSRGFECVSRFKIYKDAFRWKLKVKKSDNGTCWLLLRRACLLLLVRSCTLPGHVPILKTLSYSSSNEKGKGHFITTTEF